MRPRAHSAAERAERALGACADKVFTVWSVALHVIVYATAWIAGAGGHALFLNAISIEAVFVTLAVGVNTKLQLRGDRQAQEQRDALQDEIERGVITDQEMTQALHELVRELLDRMP